jgi:hypothetical protein
MNQARIFYGLATAILALALCRCANPGAPKGGPKDKRPPQVVQEASTPNYQTNFEKQPIELAFDEWVKTDDVFNQIVVSPPLEYRYEVSIKRRTIIFEFDERETLRDSATYTINFGTAVQDITENNPAENLRFVFSTGPYLDSLSVRGKIVDARTYKPVEGALFMLYENTADSVVRTERPFYFARTGEEGLFTIENVKADTFKGFALLDNNLNYLFDQVQEPIGFPDSLIVVAEGETPALSIRLFTEAQNLRLLSADDERYGKVRLAFNKPPPDTIFSYQDVGHRELLYEIRPDTTVVWYDLPAEKDWAIYLQQDTLLQDTVEVKANGRDAFLETAELQVLRAPNKIKPGGSYRMTFNHPLAAFDTAQLKLYQDTSRTLVPAAYRIDSSGGNRSLLVDYNWKAGLPYQLELLPAALRDLYELENDTLVQSFDIGRPKEYGNLFVTIDSLSPAESYVIEVMDGESTLETYSVSGRASYKIELTALKPGNYGLRLVEDRNGNGRWDSGRYSLYRQPEPIYDYPMERLRANWDLETTIALPKLRQEFEDKLAPPAAAMARDTAVADSLPNSELPSSVQDRLKKGKKDKD